MSARDWTARRGDREFWPRDQMNATFGNARSATRSACFVILALASVAVFWRPLTVLFGTALYDDRYSHVLLILPVSAALLYSERSRVFESLKYCFAAGLLVLPLAMALFWSSRHMSLLSSNDNLSLRTALFVGSILIGFVFCFGIAAFRAAAFPLLLLLLMIPIPDLVLERIVWLLQLLSTDATFFMLKAANIPVLKSSFVLSIHKTDIEVARECSGIRSTLILFIVSLVLGHLFLRRGWRQIVLCLLVLPIAVIRNGLRIFILAVLGVYVDPSFLYGNFHRYGGILFFCVALGLVVAFIWWLKGPEKYLPAIDQRSPRSSVI
jgi:exosortase